MRGVNKIYNSQNKPVDTAQVYIGRNRDLISKRNKALIDRYYLYSSKTKVRYDEIIKTLHEEFYISKTMVIKILCTNMELLTELKKSKPTIANLKEVHPHFNWDLKGFIKKDN